MIVFLVPLVVFGLLLGLDRLGVRPTWLRSTEAKARVALAAMFLFAATGRLANPDGLVAMLPDFLPLRREAVYVSGFFEVLGAIGLLVPRVQRLAGLGLVALLLVVFPANVNVAIHNLQIPGFPTDPFYQWARLPLQFVVIGLILWATRPAPRAPAHPARRASIPASTPA
jgi:uncharacterized membrane protein